MKAGWPAQTHAPARRRGNIAAGSRRGVLSPASGKAHGWRSIEIARNLSAALREDREHARLSGPEGGGSAAFHFDAPRVAAALAPDCVDDGAPWVETGRRPDTRALLVQPQARRGLSAVAAPGPAGR